MVCVLWELKMNCYRVINTDDSEAYEALILKLVEKSESFCLVYFRYFQNQREHQKCKEIRNQLRPLVLWRKNMKGKPLPLCGVPSELSPYSEERMVMYRCDVAALSTLKMVSGIDQWEFPDYPACLSFFKNGVAWFVSAYDEGLGDNELVCDDDEFLLELIEKGVALEWKGERQEGDLYRNPMS